MMPLEMPDSHYLSAAVGWLGLGNWREANEELEKIAPRLRTHVDVLKVRWAIYTKAEKWDMAADIAKILRDANAQEPTLWLNLAYATRRKPGGGLRSAKD